MSFAGLVPIVAGLGVAAGGYAAAWFVSRQARAQIVERTAVKNDDALRANAIRQTYEAMKKPMSSEGNFAAYGVIVKDAPSILAGGEFRTYEMKKTLERDESPRR